MKNLFLFLLFFLPVCAFSQLKSGPMLGYNTMREVAVWVQTEQETTLRFVYFQENTPSTKKEEIYTTHEDQWYTTTLIARNLYPGTTYQYRILNEKKELASGSFTTQEMWQNKGNPPDFSFAVGSCAYVNEKAFDREGEPFGKSLSIFKSLLNKNPRFMVWAGDNVYLRRPDWTSHSGFGLRYTHFKSQPELQHLWKQIHHYAIWDDHDYGPNDSDRGFIGKDLSLKAFRHFWANPPYRMNDLEGITNQFTFNDADFFLLDNRYFRSPNDRKIGEKEILGSSQIKWLIDALINSKASFKFVVVGGQFLSTAKVFENHANYKKERKLLLSLIKKEEIKNVVFLTGDRHKTELSKVKLKKDLLVYDYTCSPLASKAFDSANEGNKLQVEGTHVATQNFGILSISGEEDKRILQIQTFDAQGSLLWEQFIHQRK